MSERGDEKRGRERGGEGVRKKERVRTLENEREKE